MADRGNIQGDFDLRDAAQPGIRAIRSLWGPILLLQATAVALVLAYYRFPSVLQVTERIGHLKEQGGLAFVIATGFCAGGVLPTLAKLVTGKVRYSDLAFWSDLVFNGFVYAVIAVEVDTLYRGQAILFGAGIDWTTLVKKNFVDMALFTPFLSVPSAVWLFEWRKASFSLVSLREECSFRFFKRKVAAALVPCWAFWIPMLFCVYALPLNLQFPLAQIGEASWCLLFVFIATESGP